MPQLDAATYLSQVTWLSLFFVFYYFVGLNFILPALSGRLKVRAKKVALSKGRVSGFDTERLNAFSAYDSAVLNSCGWVSRNILNVVVSGDTWRTEQVRSIDSNVLLKSNASYLNAISGSIAQTVLFKKVS